MKVTGIGFLKDRTRTRGKTMKDNNQALSTTEGSLTPFQMSSQDAEEFERFQSTVPEVGRKKLHALWFKSQTFKGHWYNPDDTILEGQTATRSEASMLFSCFAHLVLREMKPAI
jgi:hypothetical protein